MPATQTHIGDVGIIRIVEGEPVPLPFDFFTANARTALEENDDLIRSHWLTEAGLPAMAISGFVLTVDGRNILVDACVGDWDSPGHPPGSPPSGFLVALRAAGFERGDIDVVVNTHLHFDHVGGNTYRDADGSIKPTFPNAEYLIVRDEWMAQREQPPSTTPALATMDVAVRPLVESQQAKLVDAGHQVVPGVQLTATPGHTLGHVCVEIASNGSRAVVTGDLLHHPLQLLDWSIGSIFDEDAALAATTRTAALEQWAAEHVLVLGSHFPGAGMGFMEREDRRTRYVELD